MGRPKSAGLFLFFILFFLAVHNVAAGGENILGLKKEDLAVGYIRGPFYRVNRIDAEAAFKTLSRTLGVKHGYDVHVTVESFKNGEEVEAYLQHSKLHLIIYNSLDYLKAVRNPELQPIFVPEEGGHVMRQYVLLVKNPELDSIEALKDRSLNIFYGPNNTLAVKWIEVLLKKRFNTNVNSYFGSVNEHGAPLAAILPVFFGKRDAVLVDVDKFELMAELNPQLNKLNTVAISEPYLCQILCFNRSGWTSENFREDMLKAMAKLHETPAGRQILMLFRADKIVPYEPRYLESAARLEKNELNMDNDLAKSSTAQPMAGEELCRINP